MTIEHSRNVCLFSNQPRINAARAYPTILAINDKHGTRQEFHGNKDERSIIEWARSVRKEWRWLFTRSNLITMRSRADFTSLVVDSTDFVVVAFLE